MAGEPETDQPGGRWLLQQRLAAADLLETLPNLAAALADLG